MSKPLQPNGIYEIVASPPTLKTRVGTGAGIDASLAQRAHSAVQYLRADFLQRVARTAADIAEQSAGAGSPVAGGTDVATEILRKFSDLQSQGRALGFTLLSDICGSLCHYAETRGAADHLSPKVVRSHANALRSVAGGAIEGNGGVLGQALVDSLKNLVAKSTP